MDGQRTGRWVQNMATTRRVGGGCRFPGLGGGHWHRAMGADRLPGNRRCGDGAACTRITLENLNARAGLASTFRCICLLIKQEMVLGKYVS
jgi:hypothetical protein